MFALMAYRYKYVNHFPEYDPVDHDQTGLVESEKNSEKDDGSNKSGKDESNM